MAVETKKCPQCSRKTNQGEVHCPPRKPGVTMEKGRWDELVEGIKRWVGKSFHVSAK